MALIEVAPVRIGVDIGGTFTDLQIYDARTGAIVGYKTPTTPQDPSIGLMTGIKEAADRYNFTLPDVGFLLHGTTIATNAILERKLPKAVLVTTAGFEDVLEIGRHVRREVYALSPQQPPTLIPRDCRIGVAERIRADGRVEMPLTPAALESLAAAIDRIDPVSVAVCLMNSYLNPQHEQGIAEYLAKTRPALKVSCASALSAEIREYERTSTTVLNAVLIPVIAGYLDKLTHRMETEGFRPRLLLVQSNGGVCAARTAALEPVRLLLSGPSGGSAACALLSKVLGEDNLIGVDMGGTSFDVSVVRNGRVNVVMQGEVDRMPVRIPMVEIRAIGAGGGSLAKVQRGKRLTVGPESAGSYSGPRLLRPRRRRGDGDGCECHARPDRRREISGRRDAPRRQGGTRGDRYRGGQAAQPRDRARGGGIAGRGQRKSRRRDPPVAVREGRRSPRIHHDRLRRRRRAARARGR